VHRYGNILGDNHLKDLIKKNLFTKGFDTEGLDIMITPGANQAFTNIALALCDKGDSAGNDYSNLSVKELYVKRYKKQRG
jgi:DNA-binding transcriptional MocR family regulator